VTIETRLSLALEAQQGQGQAHKLGSAPAAPLEPLFHPPTDRAYFLRTQATLRSALR
jgi:hypothetical protein